MCKKKRTIAFAGLLLCSFISGCSIFAKPEPKTHGKRIRPSFAQQNAKKKIQNSKAEVAVQRYEPPRTGVEIVWTLDSDADHFLLRYGSKPEELDRELKIEADAVERLDASDGRKLYRYIVQDAPPNATLYATVSAIKGEEISEPSPIVEVSPILDR